MSVRLDTRTKSGPISPPPPPPSCPSLRIPQIRCCLRTRPKQHLLHSPQRRLRQDITLRPLVFPEPRAQLSWHTCIAAETEFTQRARVIHTFVGIAGAFQDEAGADAAVDVFVGVAKRFMGGITGAWVGAILLRIRGIHARCS